MFKKIFSISFLFIFVLSCKSKNETVRPQKEKITESVYASGIIKSKDQYQVFSSMNSVVSEVFLQEGDTVKKGDAIVSLHNPTAQLNTENAGLAAAYAASSSNNEKITERLNAIQLAKLKMDNDASLLERQHNLWNQQIGTRNELDRAELAYKNSLNAYETAKLAYAELQKQISFQDKQAQKNLNISQSIAADYTVRSAVNGRLYKLNVSKGEMANAQSPVALIGNATDFELELQVDEYDIARIKTGQRIIVTMDSHKGSVFEAIVTKIDPSMNERSKSFTIEAVFVTAPPNLYPNLTCEANIIITSKENALTIPRSCLLEGDYVLLENKEKRKVTTGLKDYQKVEIISGLSNTDIILKPKE